MIVGNVKKYIKFYGRDVGQFCKLNKQRCKSKNRDEFVVIIVVIKFVNKDYNMCNRSC